MRLPLAAALCASLLAPAALAGITGNTKGASFQKGTVTVTEGGN
jgi:hypothetical protein